MSGDIIVPTDLDALADRIRGRLRRQVKDIVAIGADLIAVKEQLGHGPFGAWLEREFQLSVRSAQLYMTAAKWAEGKSEIISHLPPEAVRLLSAPTTPAAIQEEVVEAIRAGDNVNFKEVGERIRDERSLILDARKQEQRREARLRGKSPEYQKRLERQMDRDRAESQRRAEERARRIDEARSILQQLPAAELTRLQTISSELRFAYLEELVEGLEAEADPVAPEPIEEAVEAAQPEPVEQPAERKPLEARSPTTPIDELRAWAQTIELDRLTKHVEVGLRGCRSQLEAFLSGKHGSYHLHQAIETARADLSDYESEGAP